MKDNNIARLHVMADEGTKESVKVIKEYLDNAKTEEDICFYEIALDEAKFNYYTPENDLEKHDYALCHLIVERENLYLDLALDLEEAQDNLSDLIIDKEIHEQVASELDGDVWKNFRSPDLEEKYIEIIDKLKAVMAYYEKWIEVAKSSVTAQKYADDLQDVLEYILEDMDFDDDRDCDCDDCCGCDDDCDCDECSDKRLI